MLKRRAAWSYSVPMCSSSTNERRHSSLQRASHGPPKTAYGSLAADGSLENNIRKCRTLFQTRNRTSDRAGTIPIRYQQRVFLRRLRATSTEYRHPLCRFNLLHQPDQEGDRPDQARPKRVSQLRALRIPSS